MIVRFRTQIPDSGGARDARTTRAASAARNLQAVLAAIAIPCLLAACGDSSETTAVPEPEEPPVTLAESIEPTTPQILDFDDEAINEVEEDAEAANPSTPAEN